MLEKKIKYLIKDMEKMSDYLWKERKNSSVEDYVILSREAEIYDRIIHKLKEILRSKNIEKQMDDFKLSNGIKL